MQEFNFKKMCTNVNLAVHYKQNCWRKTGIILVCAAAQSWAPVNRGCQTCPTLVMRNSALMWPKVTLTSEHLCSLG